MGMYVDYSYYASCGGKMELDEFLVAEKAAEAYIRYMTFPNGNIFATECDAVKDAVCAAADAYHEAAQMASGNGPVKSENNDGYSVTYASQSIDGESKEKLANRKMYEAARIHLLPTGWLNRKVGCGYGNKHDCYAL